jgi:mono/diheme cytochrome c family protein
MSGNQTIQQTRQAQQTPGASFTAWSFAFAVIFAFSLLVVLQCLLIVRLTYGSGDAAADGWTMWGPWAAVPTVILFWGLVNLRWGAEALRAWKLTDAYKHLGIVLCCGLGGLGFQALLAARTITETPVVMDYSHLGAARSTKPTAAPAVVAGVAAEGQKLFSVSCITCHGPTGDGLNNLAPSLRTSDFIKSSEPAAILRVIKLGRAVTDSANKSGKAMPARGGNPFLTDQQAAHLAAFVKSLPESSAPSISAGETDPKVTTVPLARWVVPAATLPPSGLIKLSPDKQLIGSEAFILRSHQRHSELKRNLGLTVLIVHGCFLFGLFAVTSQMLFGWLLGIGSPGAWGWFTLVAWAWLVATVLWLIVWIVFGMS